jgi:SAM-dependent methyltransferase
MMLLRTPASEVDTALRCSHHGGMDNSVFDRAAASYGLVGPSLFDYLAGLIVEHTGVPAGARVLDVACGTGAVTRAMLARGSAPSAMLGVDLAFQMLRRARADLGHLPFAAAQMDAHRLGVADASCDVVLSSLAIDSLDDPLATTREIRRVTRDGGSVGLCIGPGWWWQGDDRWNWLAELLPAGERDNSGSLADQESLLRLITASGLGAREAGTADFVLRFADSEAWWRWAWSHGSRVLLEARTSDELALIRQAARENIDSSGIEARIRGIWATATP